MSTIHTSKKVHVTNKSYNACAAVALLYTATLIAGFNPSEMFYSSLVGAILTIAGTHNYADGIKGHESE